MFRFKFALGYKVLKQSLIISILKKQTSVLHIQNVKLRQNYVPSPNPWKEAGIGRKIFRIFWRESVRASERPSSIPISAWLAGWLSASQGGATAEGGREGISSFF